MLRGSRTSLDPQHSFDPNRCHHLVNRLLASLRYHVRLFERLVRLSKSHLRGLIRLNLLNSITLTFHLSTMLGMAT